MRNIYEGGTEHKQLKLQTLIALITNVKVEQILLRNTLENPVDKPSRCDMQHQSLLSGILVKLPDQHKYLKAL